MNWEPGEPLGEAESVKVIWKPQNNVPVDEERAQSLMKLVATLEDGWASTLTAAELRLLPLLTTHLSFREIAERLYVSEGFVPGAEAGQGNELAHVAGVGA